MSIGASAYALQYSLGRIRMHVIGNIISAILYVPCVIFAAMKYGAIGAASVWLIINLLYLLFWISLIHSKLVPGLNRLWFTVDTSLILFAGFVPGIFFYLLPIDIYKLNRIESLIFIIFLGIASFALSAMASSASRALLKRIRWRAPRALL